MRIVTPNDAMPLVKFLCDYLGIESKDGIVQMHVHLEYNKPVTVEVEYMAMFNGELVVDEALDGFKKEFRTYELRKVE